MVFPKQSADAAADWNKHDYPFVKRVLLHYAGLYGNMRVPKAFLVPATTAWPYDMHGVDLGKVGWMCVRWGVRACVRARIR